MRLSLIFILVASLSVAAYARRGGGGGGTNPLMGSVVRSGFEIGVATGSTSNIDGVSAAPLDTGTVRSGSNSLKCDSGPGAAGDNTTRVLYNVASQSQTFVRAYFNFSNFPDSTVPIILPGLNPSINWSVRLKSTGALALFNPSNAQVGSDSAILSTGVWYRVEIWATSGNLGSPGNGELRLDGVTVASGTSTATVTDLATIYIGWYSSPGTNKVLYVDDVAINNSLGTSQNTWPGDGSEVFLRAISDAQVGSWAAGAGGTTNLWDAVDNTPPTGSASPTNTSQIGSVDTTGNNATDEYRVNLETYASKGIQAGDTITLVQAVIMHGERVATGTKTGSFAILSNPTQSGVDTFTFGADAGAVGTWPTNWAGNFGTAQHLPSVVLGTSPVVAVRKTDAGSTSADVTVLGLMVEYIPSSPSAVCFMSPFGRVMQPF